MKNFRLALETALVRFAIWLVPKLSRRAIMNLGKALGAVSYAVDYRGRAAAHANLRAAFVQEHITSDQIRRIAVASYQTFARTFLDLFWSRGLTRESIHNFVKTDFDDPHLVETARAEGSLWVTPHFGNFEVISLFMGFEGLTMVVVAQDFKNPALTEAFTGLRQHSGHKVIPQQGAMLRLVKELKRKGHAALLTDLNIKPNKTAAVIDCFGLKTCVTTLHAVLSKRLSLPVIMGLCIPLEDGTYIMKGSPPIYGRDFSSPEEMVQAVWDHFEKYIRQMPECWLWMYKHWRYLPPDAEESQYPAYANTNKGFNALISS